MSILGGQDCRYINGTAHHGKSIETSGPQITLRNMSVLPVILIFAFVALSIIIRTKYAKK